MRLQRRALLVLGRRDPLQHQVEEGGEVGALFALLQRRPAGPGVRVDDRKVDLRLVGIEVEEELIDLIDHLADPGIGPIDLVHHQDHRQMGLERLAEHEARLGEGPLGGVDEEQHPIDHRQPALDLPTEVRMPGRVDDVELGLPVPNGRVLGEDRDPLLPLEIHGVHDPLGDVLPGPKRPGLPEHGVDERRLAMVDVGDDRDVAEVGAAGHGARDGRGRLCVVPTCRSRKPLRALRIPVRIPHRPLAEPDWGLPPCDGRLSGTPGEDNVVGKPLRPA